MNKKIKKTIISGVITVLSLGSVSVLAGTLGDYGNKMSASAVSYYSYSYTQAIGSWASTSWHACDIPSGAGDFTCDSAYSASGWAQTPTSSAGYLNIPTYSLHSCDSHTARKSF